MLYIHALSHLNQKSAQLESVYLLRELRRKPQALLENSLRQEFGEFFVSETDRQRMRDAISLIEPLLSRLSQLKDPGCEPLNVQRASSIIKELPVPLSQNLSLTEEIAAWQEHFSPLTSQVLQGIRSAATPEAKAACNSQLNMLFQKLLRSSDFTFRHADLLHEAPLAHIKGLAESMAQGFLLHRTLEEELHKVPFSGLKLRFPPVLISEVEEIRRGVDVISLGAEQAYAVNMRLVQWSVLAYAYVRLALEK